MNAAKHVGLPSGRSWFRLRRSRHRKTPVQHIAWSYGFDDTAGGGLDAIAHLCWCEIGEDHEVLR